jgi:hypothetical protein
MVRWSLLTATLFTVPMSSFQATLLRRTQALPKRKTFWTNVSDRCRSAAVSNRSSTSATRTVANNGFRSSHFARKERAPRSARTPVFRNSSAASANSSPWRCSSASWRLRVVGSSSADDFDHFRAPVGEREAHASGHSATLPCSGAGAPAARPLSFSLTSQSLAALASSSERRPAEATLFFSKYLPLTSLTSGEVAR